MACSKCGKDNVKIYYSGVCPTCYYLNTDVKTKCLACGKQIQLHSKGFCRLCYNKNYNKKYYEKKAEDIKKQVKEYYYKNHEKGKEYRREYSKNNPNKEYHKKYHEEHREKRIQNMNIYYKENSVEINKKQYQYKKVRLQEDTNFYLKDRLSTRIRMAIMNHGGIKDSSAIELLGASIEVVRKHLESLFKEGMTWENHGITGWHIDHIIPCDSFDLTKKEEQLKCFHYTNLQPLWYKDNLRKKNLLDYSDM